MLKFEELPEINSERWLSLENLPGEEWKDVSKYEKYFQISNYGRLKRKERLTFCSQNNSFCKYTSKIIKLSYNHKGYASANLSIDGKRLFFNIHHIVALCFIPNPNNLPFINHKDENPSNNCIYNLEWCTPKYNSNYGTSKDRIRKQKIEKGFSVPVVLYDYDGNVIKKYKTAKDAALDNGMSRGNIINCCEGVCSVAKGLHFRYVNDKYEKRDIKRSRSFYQVYKDGNLIIETNDCKKMCKAINISYGHFRAFVIYSRGTGKSFSDYLFKIKTSKGKQYIIENGFKKEFGL